MRGRSLRSKVRGRGWPQMNTDQHRWELSMLESVCIRVNLWLPISWGPLRGRQGAGRLFVSENDSDWPNRGSREQPEPSGAPESSKTPCLMVARPLGPGGHRRYANMRPTSH